MGKVCPTCGGEYKNIAGHWSWNSDHRESFSEHQKELITGILLGDGCINRHSGYPNLRVEMIVQEYLDFLHKEFGIFSNGVNLHLTAGESAKNSREYGFDVNANEKNYSDLYLFRTINHPELINFQDWYSTGEKVFPKDVQMTPTVLKHWFVGDGSKSKNGIKITSCNELDSKVKINSWFENADLPKPSWQESDRRGAEGIHRDMRWFGDNMREIYEYMGKPPAGFGYKWPAETVK